MCIAISDIIKQTVDYSRKSDITLVGSIVTSREEMSLGWRKGCPFPRNRAIIVVKCVTKMSVENMLHTNPFVQLVMQAKDKVLCIILYTEEQLQDIRRLCCSSPHGQTTVLGFDKTYNLGDIHVTASVLNHLAVTRARTDEHPIFAEPMSLHGNSDYNTYTFFFQHLASKLQECSLQPVSGSDQEKAMCKAMDYAFPSAAHLTCTRHMHGNAEDYLRDSIGVSEADRARVVDTIFGKNGLAEADESVLFDCRLQLVREACRKFAPAFEHDFDGCIVPVLHANLTASETPGLQLPPRSWTNNNCESMNHVLK